MLQIRLLLAVYTVFVQIGLYLLVGTRFGVVDAVAVFQGFHYGVFLHLNLVLFLRSLWILFLEVGIGCFLLRWQQLLLRPH